MTHWKLLSNSNGCRVRVRGNVCVLWLVSLPISANRTSSCISIRYFSRKYWIKLYASRHASSPQRGICIEANDFHFVCETCILHSFERERERSAHFYEDMMWMVSRTHQFIHIWIEFRSFQFNRHYSLSPRPFHSEWNIFSSKLSFIVIIIWSQSVILHPSSHPSIHSSIHSYIRFGLNIAITVTNQCAKGRCSKR